MSAEKLRHSADRWLRQAEHDLESAEGLARLNMHPQACFYSQQAAEKALKAVWKILDEAPRGHSVTVLIDQLPEQVRPDFSPVRHAALALDKLYIPTRYPDALSGLIPAEAYGTTDSDAAIRQSRSVLVAAAAWLKRPSSD